MIIAPGIPAIQETRHSRELSRRIDQVVREYQSDHPDATSSDVRAALMHLAPDGDEGQGRRRRVAGIAAAAVMVGVFTAVAASGGRGFEGNMMTWRIIGVVAALLGVTIAIIRAVRRG